MEGVTRNNPITKIADTPVKKDQRPPMIAGSEPAASQWERKRIAGLLFFLAVMIAAYCRPLLSLIAYAANNDLDSYVLLIPFISGYLLYLRRKELPGRYESSIAWATILLAAGFAAVALEWYLRRSLSQNDSLSLMTLAFVCSLAAGGFLFLGWKWMCSAAFPIGFLIFLVPLPNAAVHWLEMGSMLASAEMASLFFAVSGIPVLRDGTRFQLPDITIQVAKECSGIHSSLILVIASLLAAHLLLITPWRRAALIVFAIPLGVIRNGFRILVLGWLCTHFGPQMIDSPIHHEGGPVFFVISLAPFCLFLWALSKGDRKTTVRASGLQPNEQPI